MPSSCAAEDSWEALGKQGDQTSQSQRKSTLTSLEGLMLNLKLQYFGHLMWRTDSLEKSQMLGKSEEEEIREDEMIGCHHQLKGYEFEQTPRDGEGQGSLACCHPWGHKESDMTERLNNKGMNLICLLSCEASILTLHVQWIAKWKNYSYQMVQNNSQVQCKNFK